jgi:hypothetical protein
MAKNIGDYEILFYWSHLDWLFDDETMKAQFYEQEYWKGALPNTGKERYLPGLKLITRGIFTCLSLAGHPAFRPPST